jgi:Fe-S-cluster containining protein
MFVTIGNFRLSPELFVRSRLVNRCLRRCAGDCCDEGVFLTLYDARRIIERRDEIQPYLTRPFDFDTWDISHPANIATPLQNEGTLDQRCWFFTQGRRCALHALALDRNFPIKSIKPFFCLLFPLTLVDIDFNLTEICLETKAYQTCLREGEKEDWLFKQFGPDLTRILGEDGYEELEQMFQE